MARPRSSDTRLLNMRVTVTSPKNLAKIDLQDRRFLLWLGPKLIREFRSALLSGQTADGKKLPEYTQAYGKWKRRQGKSNQPTNLKLRGGLLSSMNMRVIKTGVMRIAFAGKHPSSTRKAKLSDKRRRFLEARVRQGKANKEMIRALELGEEGKRAMSNQELANVLAGRWDTGKWKKTGAGKPHYAFMEPSRMRMHQIAREYQDRVVLPQARGLPAMISDKDIQHHLRRHVQVKKTP